MKTLSEITISSDLTHHLIHGVPMYQRRFDEVLKYHEPGIAPVSANGQWWHIDTKGADAYTKRFKRTFGFYCNRAAVHSEKGWCHILSTGKELYPERYDWCGNFQENKCTVRDIKGNYFHIDLAGCRIYKAEWKYAGDFKDGIAVVQSEIGLSTHIDSSGELLHGIWFEDLDVFHKNFARAKDKEGWFHITLKGTALYEKRYKMLEPFYNGQARAETKSGTREVIDETGKRITKLCAGKDCGFHDLSSDLVGYWRTYVLSAAVQLGIVEPLPATSSDIALSIDLSQRSTERMLFALAELGAVELIGEIWDTTKKGKYLKLTHPLSLADASLEYPESLLDPWKCLLEALRAGDNWSPTDFFEATGRSSKHVARLHKMFKSYALFDYANLPSVIDWNKHDTIIDAGGGLGIISFLLLESTSKLKSHLFDRSEVLDLVSIPDNLSSRLNLQPGDLFSPWNVTGDAIILARILHDWCDAKCRVILQHAKEALRDSGVLYIIDMVRDSSNGAMCDLHMLVSTGGTERTYEEVNQLLSETGFIIKEVVSLGSVPSLIIAKVRDDFR